MATQEEQYEQEASNVQLDCRTNSCSLKHQRGVVSTSVHTGGGLLQSSQVGQVCLWSQQLPCQNPISEEDAQQVHEARRRQWGRSGGPTGVFKRGSIKCGLGLFSQGGANLTLT
eukprot:1158748-Pelagomonas_calceolata.AAC.13